MDVSKTSWTSSKQILEVIRSGLHRQDVTGTYTTGVLNTVQLATGIDVNKQFVYAFGTGNYNVPNNPYGILQDSYEVIINQAGSPQSASVDVYFYVDTSNNLQLRYKNISFSGSYSIITPAYIQVAWYLLEVTDNP